MVAVRPEERITNVAQEAQQTAGATVIPGVQYGFLTDVTLCIGCKACEVACKQWNQLPADGLEFTGTSYDNTKTLSSTTWRHVLFLEDADQAGSPRWTFMSDICKHCQEAGCMDACPTGAIIRGEFGNVYVQPDVCNGCGYCVPSCPFGVVEVNEEWGIAAKCTECYDRQRGGFEPACAKACPTNSIQYGPLPELRQRARERIQKLHQEGVEEAYVYGDQKEVVSGLNNFFILTDRPERFNLPVHPRLPADNILPGTATAIVAALGLGVLTALSFLARNGRGDRP